MAASASLRYLTSETVTGLAGKVVATRSTSLPALWFPIEEDGGKVLQVASAYLVYVRSNGFMVVTSSAEAVQTAVTLLDAGVGEPPVAHECTLDVCTSRGRVLGTAEACLVDVPMNLVQSFCEVPSTRMTGVKDVIVLGLESAGEPARPVASSACQAADAWISQDMEAETAEDYLTGQEVELESEHADADPAPESPAGEGPLLARIAQLEAQLKKSQKAPSSRLSPLGGKGTVAGPGKAQSLFKQASSADGQLSAADWAKLQSLAGPPPLRTQAATRQTMVKPLTAAAENTYAELEKDVIESGEVDPHLKMLQLPGLDPNQPLDSTQQILLASLQQNSMLLQKLVGNKPADPMVSLLSGGDSGSGSSSGVKGCLAREAFVRGSSDLVSLGETIRANALSELGMSPDREDASVLRRFVERRMPLADHKLLAHFATMLAEGWAVAYNSGNAEMLGFVGKAMMFTEQVAIDQGKLQLAWLLTGYAEPNAQMMISNRHRPGLKPFSSLASPSWVSANLAYMRDLDFLEGRMSSLGGKTKNANKAENSVEEKDPKKIKKGKGKGKQQSAPAPAQEQAAV